MESQRYKKYGTVFLVVIIRELEFWRGETNVPQSFPMPPLFTHSLQLLELGDETSSGQWDLSRSSMLILQPIHLKVKVLFVYNPFWLPLALSKKSAKQDWKHPPRALDGTKIKTKYYYHYYYWCGNNSTVRYFYMASTIKKKKQRNSTRVTLVLNSLISFPAYRAQSECLFL